MDRILLSLFTLFIATGAFAQITIDQTDVGQVGDSLTVAYESPSTNINVGAASSSSQNWNFTFAVDDINTLKFEDPANTVSGAYFGNADIAIERQDDTLFFGSSSSALVLDGITGDGFGLGASILADFNPNATIITFPSTMGTAFLDTAVFDTIVSCAAFGQGGLCDSARLRRTLISDSEIDAFGKLVTSGGTYDSTIRQFRVEYTEDRVWVKLPFVGWQSTPFYSVDSTAYNYLWYATGQKWPVLSVEADGQAGNIVNAEFQVDNLLGYVVNSAEPSCNGDCDGSAEVGGIGADPPYTYAWPASAGSQTTATATGLCAGTYMVTITDSDTDSYEVEVILDEPNELQVSGATQGVSIGGDGAIDITASGGTGSGTYTYNWTGPDGFTASTSDISGLEEGDYTVTVTDGNGCTTEMTFTVALTGIGGVDQNGFKMFPNPANDGLNISTNYVMENIRVSDLLGNLVMNRPLNGSAVELSVSELSSGIYMVEIQTDQGIYLEKLTVRH